jgi:competence protein ComEA
MDHPIRTRLATLALFLGLSGTSLLGAPRRPPERPVDLNAATVTELMQLPRVGPKTAERIVAWRREHGRFRRPEDLMNVKGIGEKAFLRLRPHIKAD